MALAFWTARVAHTSIRAGYRKADAAATDGVLINGARLSLRDINGLALVDGSPPKTAATLLLVLSDTCPSVGKLMPTWVELIHSIPPTASVHLSVVTLGGNERLGELVRAAKSKGVAYSAYRVDALRSFALATGINSTPFAIALDADSRLRRVLLGLELQAIPSARIALTDCLWGSGC